LVPHAEEWFKKADEDYRVAERELAAEPPAYGAVCFHAQQAVEKLFKGLLVDAGVDFPRTHDLTFLLRVVNTKTSVFAALGDELTALSIAAVEVRYPGSQPDRRQADAAVATMKAVFEIHDKHYGQ